MNTGVEIGATLVGYRVETLLGRGGMGFVYRAEHLALGRKVALKVLAPELTDNKEFRSRFMLESRTAARLEHPNIIPIYEAGEADGRLYIAMRYVAGHDLGALIASEGRRCCPARRLPPRVGIRDGFRDSDGRVPRAHAASPRGAARPGDAGVRAPTVAGSIATRRLTPTVLSFAVVIATALALLAHFAAR